MGAGRSRESAELLVEFAHIDRDDAIGARHEIAGEFCSMPPMQDIPDLPKAHHPFSVDFQDPFRAHNTDYYREVSQYQFLVRLCRAVRLTVKNIGEVPASNVRLEITIPMTAGILPRARLPNEPVRSSRLDRHIEYVRSPFRRDPGDVTIDENTDRFRIEIDCKDLQPGRRIWSDEFYIGVQRTGEYTINGEVLADNLPAPQPFSLTVTATIEQTRLGLKELLRM